MPQKTMIGRLDAGKPHLQPLDLAPAAEDITNLGCNGNIKGSRLIIGCMYHPWSEPIPRLRADIVTIEARARSAEVLPFGIGRVDAKLIDDELRAPALDDPDRSSHQLAGHADGRLFTVGIVARFAPETGCLLWAVSWFDLCSPRLEQAGTRPNQLLFIECQRDGNVSAAKKDVLHQGGPAAVDVKPQRASFTMIFILLATAVAYG